MGIGMLLGGPIIGGLTGYFFGEQIRENVIENLPRITGTLQVAGGAIAVKVGQVIINRLTSLPMSKKSV